VQNPAASPDGKAIFDRGLAAMTSWNSVHFTERLGGGGGTYSLTNFIYHDVSDGQPAAMQISTADSEVIRMNGLQWVRQDGDAWDKSDAGPVIPPSQWGADYEGADSFQPGPTVQYGDRTAQIVSFHVASATYATAWYCWWVDTETGNILQETMVSRGHYMVRIFDDINSAPPVTPPTN
jgi:hypothetical protein